MSVDPLTGQSIPSDKPSEPPSAPPVEIHGWGNLLNPVVLIPIMILSAIFFMIGMAIFGWDSMLLKMGNIEFARGLITYLFAVVTIGTAVVLVVSALTSTDDEVHERRFQRGKEILALLLGVFGTIVGFYFGSEVSQKKGVNGGDLTLAPLHLSAQTVTPGTQFTVEAVVTGGTPPYKFGVGFDKDKVDPGEPVGGDSWLQKTMTTPAADKAQDLPVHLIVIDSAKHTVEATQNVTVKPAASK